MNVLVIQTAFLGDVILTLPLVQAIRSLNQTTGVHMMVLPGASNVVSGCPAVDSTIVFDKKGAQRGIRELVRLGRRIRAMRFDAVVTPHRSLRTALLTLMSGAPVRIGFDRSALPSVFTTTVTFSDKIHEADRNLQLLRGLGVDPPAKERPRIVPHDLDKRRVDEFIRDNGLTNAPLIAIAPGSVWYTKRWPPEHYAGLVRILESKGFACVILGGSEDGGLAGEILSASSSGRSVSAAGKFTLLQSAELIGRAQVLVTNDSAPLHLGVSMGTPVAAIFGPTVPEFGFAPYGPDDVIIQRENLECRPCTKHGGPSCPIGTFECMLSVSPESVAARVVAMTMRSRPD